MRSRKKLVLAASVLALLVVAQAALWFAARGADAQLNGLQRPPPYEAGKRARELHDRLLVADLHADTLLWNRDLLARGSRGHVDLPRLQDGGVGLQAFFVVTKTPRQMNIHRNDDSTDNIALLALGQMWPPGTWMSLKARALYQASRLQRAAHASDGRLMLVRTQADLAKAIERRKADRTFTAAILGLEGAHALEGDPANVDALYDAGFRVIAPVHFFDNEMAGSAHGVKKGGLTDKGREMVRRIEERRMLVDLAHASEETLDEVLAMATRPVIVSHTGVRGTCDNERNLSDLHLREVARTGGVVGIGFWDTAVCGKDVRAIARAVRHAARIAGVQHVALGSDFDGAVPTPFDSTGLALLTEALLDAGFGERDIELIMGGNTLRVLGETLPE